MNCDAPWPPGIVYPAPFLVAEAHSKLPSEDVVHVLRALADDTRLRALKLIADRPRSTQELAPLVGISEAGLSKHLRLLARAGLLRSRRDGYHVLYSLEPERITPLSDALCSPSSPSKSRYGAAASTRCRQRRVPSMTRMAVKPTIAFTMIRLIRIPTLKLSSTARAALPRKR